MAQSLGCGAFWLGLKLLQPIDISDSVTLRDCFLKDFPPEMDPSSK